MTTDVTVTDEAVASLEGTADPRLKELLTGLIRHLHAFARETRLTQAEWERAIGFLTETGQTCTDTRQEFILLSDVLGLSMLVETVNGDHAAGSTESTVLGPFHMTESPVRRLGANIDLVGGGEPVRGQRPDRLRRRHPAPRRGPRRVAGRRQRLLRRAATGRPTPGNGRGLFTADAEGRFWFRTCVPSPYPIPTDGPVGELLKATARHPYRPAHIHFIASAEGHTPVTTHIFVAGSDYLDSDAVFAVKQSLVEDFTPTDDPSLAREFGIENPFRHARFDLVLDRA